MRDFFAFRTMLTPILIQILFWVGVILAFASGVYLIVAGLLNQSFQSVYYGIGIFILGPIAVRIAAEVLMLFFRINETLTEIRRELAATPKLTVAEPRE